VDLRPIVARLAARQAAMSWTAAHQVLVDHQPVPGFLRARCGECGGRYPCEAREQALNELTGDTQLRGWT
jgi:hypothetical protein